MYVSARAKGLMLAAAAGLVLCSIVFKAATPRASATVSGDAGATYLAKCASCHAKDGSGNTPAGKKLSLKDLRSPEVQGMSDAQLTAIIGKGKGKMPGYEKSLGADGVKAQVAYVRGMK